MARAPTLVVSFLGMFVLAVQASAQEVVGVIVDEASGAVVAGVEVTLRAMDRDGAWRTITDDEGRFSLSGDRDGAFTLSVSGLAYQPFTSEPIRLSSRERLVVAIRLGVDALPLDPVVVTDRSRRHPPDITAFYERLERGRRAGGGSFVSRSDVEGSYPSRTTDLLRSMSGVQVGYRRGGRDTMVQMRGGCIPAIYVDGSFINRVDTRLSLDDYVNPRSVEGIEVYHGPSRSVGHYHDPRGCGLILVWTRRGEHTGSSSLHWAAVGGLLGLVLGLFLITN